MLSNTSSQRLLGLCSSDRKRLRVLTGSRVKTPAFKSAFILPHPRLNPPPSQSSSPQNFVPHPRSLRVQALPLQSRPVHSKLHQTSMLHLRHVSRAPVGTAKTNVARQLPDHVNPPHSVPIWTKFYHLTLP